MIQPPPPPEDGKSHSASFKVDYGLQMSPDGTVKFINDSALWVCHHAEQGIFPDEIAKVLFFYDLCKRLGMNLTWPEPFAQQVMFYLDASCSLTRPLEL